MTTTTLLQLHERWLAKIYLSVGLEEIEILEVSPSAQQVKVKHIETPRVNMLGTSTWHETKHIEFIQELT